VAHSRRTHEGRGRASRPAVRRCARCSRSGARPGRWERLGLPVPAPGGASAVGHVTYEVAAGPGAGRSCDGSRVSVGVPRLVRRRGSPARGRRGCTGAHCRRCRRRLLPQRSTTAATGAHGRMGRVFETFGVAGSARARRDSSRSRRCRPPVGHVLRSPAGRFFRLYEGPANPLKFRPTRANREEAAAPERKPPYP